MKRTTLLALLAPPVLGQNDLPDSSQTTDIFAGSTLSCLGTSTYTGYVPLETVTVTVDGNYTYSASGNVSTPTAAIFYTPPPACASIVVPQPPPSNDTTIATGSLPTEGPLPTASSEVVNSTYTSVITWTETSTSVECVPNFAKVSSTANTGPPYANSSTGSDTTVYCSSFLRFGTFTSTTTGTYSVFVSGSPQPAPVASSASKASTTRNPHQPDILTTSEAQGPPVVVTTASSAGRSSVATVTVTKKTPVPAPATNTANQIVFPTVTDDGVGSPNAVPSKTSAKPSAVNPGPGSTNGGNTGGGISNGGNGTPTNKPSPAPGNDSSTGGNNNPTGGNAVPTSGSGNRATNANSPSGNAPSPTGGQSSVGGNSNPASSKNNPVGASDTEKSTASTSRVGGGIGSIINSAFNSPFTTVGVTTSYGAASATVNLVNGVPVQVESSSVYIGGSYVAIPTGSSTTLVTVAGQTFTVGPSAVIGGSNTLEIHRSESISSSPVQAATLHASTITQNGVVVTIEPTAAVVSGKTYSIGLNAEETKIVVGGQTITLNSNGVAFASTTYQPAMVTTAAYVVSTVGALTFSIDSSEAIISGTTYRIGAGALNSVVTTTIDGTTVIFGPSGIVLPSTTIAPTGVSLTLTNTQSAKASESATVRVVSDPTSSATATSTSNGALISSRPPTYLSNTLYMFWTLLALSTLPLGLLL